MEGGKQQRKTQENRGRTEWEKNRQTDRLTLLYVLLRYLSGLCEEKEEEEEEGTSESILRLIKDRRQSTTSFP
jgi:hypothetical protein